MTASETLAAAAERRAAQVTDNDVRRATIAGAIGSFVEWYDYGIYGLLTTYLAINIMGGAQAGALFLTNVGFLVSFIARPFSSSGDNSSLVHSSFYAPGAPRTAWVGVRYQFDAK